MKRILISCLCILTGVFVGCGDSPKQTKEVSAPVEGKTFKHVSVPAVYNTPQQRAEYLAGHFWDHFDFADTTYIGLPEVTEQALVDYINTLSICPQAVVKKSIDNTLNKASVDSIMFAHFTELFEKYLYDPNSPMRNEPMYVCVLEHVVSSDRISDLDKTRPSYQLQLASKNKIGDVATDFSYTEASGRTSRMHSIDSPYLLLFFNNPGCPACLDITNGFSASPLLSRLVSEEKLVVLAIYPDEDLKAWREHVMPKEWINGYATKGALRNDELYDLRAIPNLYLLDKDKRVLLKDAQPAQVEDYLQRATM